MVNSIVLNRLVCHQYGRMVWVYIYVTVRRVLSELSTDGKDSKIWFRSCYCIPQSPPVILNQNQITSLVFSLSLLLPLTPCFGSRVSEPVMASKSKQSGNSQILHFGIRTSILSIFFLHFYVLYYLYIY
jgi:hypothetical protein